MSTLNLSDRHLFITGGTGFIGRTLLDFLIAWRGNTGQRFRVEVMSRQPLKFLKRYPEYSQLSWLTFVEGSLTRLPPAAPYSDIIHAAADTHFQGYGLDWVEQIVNGTAAVLDFAARSGVARFLHISSGAVYGPQPRDLLGIPEDYCGGPSTELYSSTYGQAKRVAEQLCTIYFRERGLHAINARCFAIASRHIPLDGPYALGNFIRDVLYGDKICVKGDGTAIRSYLDGEDMAYWLLKLLQTGSPGESYNIGSDRGVTIKELADLVTNQLSPRKPVVMMSEISHDEPKSRYIPCISKIAKLGLVPLHDLEQTIARVLRAHLHPSQPY
jgi:nucleoside-diphosphate-sugar epimerase